MRIGVVADTHGFFDPQLRSLWKGVEAIVHGGDVGTQRVLDELGRVAPVRAVRGNVDGTELHLPSALAIELGGVSIAVEHILPVSEAQLETWSAPRLASPDHDRRRENFLGRWDEAVRVVIFGHSHRPCLVVVGGRLFFNPGSAGKKRFSLPRCCGLLEISGREITGTILFLEGYNRPQRKKLALA